MLSYKFEWQVSNNGTEAEEGTSVAASREVEQDVYISLSDRGLSGICVRHIRRKIFKWFIRFTFIHSMHIIRIFRICTKRWDTLHFTIIIPMCNWLENVIHFLQKRNNIKLHDAVHTVPITSLTVSCKLQLSVHSFTTLSWPWLILSTTVL